MVLELAAGALLAVLVFGVARFQDAIVSALTGTQSGHDPLLDEP